jgi:hypothetical protein
VTLGRPAGRSKPGMGIPITPDDASDEIEARSKGANSKCDSHNSIIYRSSHIRGPSTDCADCPLTWGESQASNAERRGSKYLGSLLKNRLITFSPRTLQRVYNTLQMALGNGIVTDEWCRFLDRTLSTGRPRQLRNADINGGRIWVR